MMMDKDCDKDKEQGADQVRGRKNTYHKILVKKIAAAKFNLR